MLVDAATTAASGLADTWKARAAAPRVSAAVSATGAHVGLSAAGSAISGPGPAAAGIPHIAGIALKEELVAITIALAIRDALSRLAYNVLYIAVGTFLVFASHMLFPFQAKQRLLALIWVDIVMGVAVALTVLFLMEKDEVLSRMADTTPGRITWNRDTIVRVVVYGLVPLLTLFAAQFPEVGAQLLEWLKPIQRSIP
jgi:hypothetical protein